MFLLDGQTRHCQQVGLSVRLLSGKAPFIRVLLLERLTIEMPPKIVGRERLKIFPPRLEGLCPFQPYKNECVLKVGQASSLSTVGRRCESRQARSLSYFTESQLKKA
jgi:hypothetical protein